MAGSIRKISDGVYEISYFLGRTAEGKQRRKYMRVRGTRSEAEKKLAQQIAAISTGALISSDRQTLAQFLGRWLSEMQPLWAYKTHRWHEANTRLYINPLLGGIQLSKLAPLHIQSAYKDLLTKPVGHDGTPLSPFGLTGVHRTLRSALGKAVEWKLLVDNPAANVTIPVPPRVKQVTLSAEQAGKLLEASRKTGRYSLYLTALLTGMRQNELIGLRWADIDWNNNVIYVRQQLVVKKAGANEYAPPKSKTEREVAIIPELRTALLQQWETEQALSQRPGFRNYGLVWHTSDGEPIGPRNLTRQFKLLLQHADLPDVRFHDLRHSCATLLLAQGVDIKIISQILGHSQISITANLYSHPNRAVTSAAMSLVGAAISNAQNPTESTSANPHDHGD